jgi:hypothetical protein
MEVICSFETLVTIYRTTQHNSEDLNPLVIVAGPRFRSTYLQKVN